MRDDGLSALYGAQDDEFAIAGHHFTKVEEPFELDVVAQVAVAHNPQLPLFF